MVAPTIVEDFSKFKAPRRNYTYPENRAGGNSLSR